LTNHRIPIIGLAGGIGAGKSSVAKILAEFGCLVSDSDAGARASLRDPKIKQTIVQWWGDRVLDEHSDIHRPTIASIIFADPAERRRLESLTHPWIEAKRKQEFAAAPPGTPALVIDAPLLFEAGLDRACDAVIYVDADPEVRLARVRRNRGWSDAELSQREISQLPLDEKRSRADHVVTNNGDLGELKAQVRLALDTILASCRT
jgi:dephospho-CoA kinase